MERQKLGCCGLDCNNCPVFIATENDDDELRQKTAKDWYKLYAEYLGKNVLKPEDMNCRGCQSESGLFIGCGNCPIRKCCREKKYNTCASCNAYEKCEMLNGFFTVPSHQQAKDNLDRLRS